MLQESGFAADLGALETLALIGGLTGREDRPERVLDLVGLSAKADTRVAALSGGEKRRLDFATAVYGSPELIFLDEPTTGLDIQSRDDLWGTVDRLREDGATIVLTTHYLEEAQQRADRIGLMHEGTLRMQGTVGELTRTLPGTITFGLDESAAARLPFESTATAAGARLIRTQALQEDLRTLLNWAETQDAVLHDLAAGPTRLDDVFRAVSHD
jgi:ABC-2 type transport system ATP-binding protein